MTYSATHQRALNQMKRKGAAVSFTLATPGTEQNDGTFTGASSGTVLGYATEDPTSGDLTTFEALSLTSKRAKRLLFIPTTFGDVPELGASCVWGGQAYKAMNVAPYSADGTAIFSHVVLT